MAGPWIRERVECVDHAEVRQRMKLAATPVIDVISHWAAEGTEWG